MFAPRYTISSALLEDLKRIAVLVSRLNQFPHEARTAPELSLEARSVSAYASTTIEGNPLPLTAVRALLRRSPHNPDASEREVVNYDRAATRLEAEPFGERLLLRLHRDVTDGLLLPAKSGAYRREPVFVHDPRTGEVVFWPPDHADVPRLMKALFEFQSANAHLDAVVLAGLFHKRFVLIHPFVDGNGRTARLASSALLRHLNLDLIGLVSFEEYLARDITRYFRHVGERGNFYDLDIDFTPWLEYFAQGILDELRRLEKSLEALGPAGAAPRAGEAGAGTHPAVRLKSHHRAVLDHLSTHGSITDREYAGLVDRAKSTRALDFRFLLEHGLIERHGRGPAVYYTLRQT